MNNLKTALLKPLAFLSLSVSASLMLPSVSSAQTCYVWTGEDGVKHFGSIPPTDVAATTVSCNNKAPASANESKYDIDTLAQQRKAREQREQQCKEEKKRLKTLKTSGSRIRMIGEDGQPRYLTDAEVKAEVELSEGFITQNCK